MTKPVNPLLAAIVILVVLVAALFVMYQRSNLPPPVVGEEIRQRHQPKYEDQERRMEMESRMGSEGESTAPEAQSPEDAE